MNDQRHPYADHPAAAVLADHRAPFWPLHYPTVDTRCECGEWRGPSCDHPAHLAEVLQHAGLLTDGDTTGDPDHASPRREGRQEDDMNDEEMAHYSRALDEVHRLRGLLAYESQVLIAHLDYKSFPKSRRKIAEEQIARMGQAALGFSEKAMESVNRRSLRQIRQEYGIETLTRREFETELAGQATPETGV